MMATDDWDLSDWTVQLDGVSSVTMLSQDIVLIFLVRQCKVLCGPLKHVEEACTYLLLDT